MSVLWNAHCDANPTMKLRAEALLAMGVFGGAAACGPPPATAHAPAPARYTATGGIDPGVVPDARIKAVLVRELERDRVVSTEHVGVDAENGIVTLTATVATQLAKERAVAVAHVVRGVRAVIDRIDVAPRPYDDLRLDIVVAGILSGDPVTRGQRVAAQSREGVVHLYGEMDSNAARQIAESDVLGIPGVQRVNDDIAVFPPTRSNQDDARMTETVKRFIGDDPFVDDANIRAWTVGGHVTLSGYVGSFEEKVRAEDDARTASPRGVDSSGLRVDVWTDDGTVRARPPLTLGDRQIGQALLDAYVEDTRVHPFAPSIDVRDRVVILTGVAPNAEAKAAAAEDAGNATGVVDVRDDL